MVRRLVELPAWFAMGLVVVSLGLAGIVSTQLADGWAEIPDHWWSTLAVGTPLGLAALWLLSRRFAA